MEHTPNPTAHVELSEREMAILRLMADGFTNQEIADRLYLALTTVKWYIRQINTKLDTHSRTQTVSRAHQLKLIGDSDEAQIALIEADEPPENPYKGLRAFQKTDAADFFGREAFVQQLLTRLGESHRFAHFLAVIGPSGSGKSSVVNAGLIPALEGLTTGERSFIAQIMPGTHPLEELEVALLRLAAHPPTSLLGQLREDERGLLRAARRILPDDNHILVLVIDQFEEVFTLVEDEHERQYFLDLIYAGVSEPHSPLRVIVTLRADFYDRPMLYPRFGEMITRRAEAVLPLTVEELTQAIVRPAERVGVLVEAGLVRTIIAEVNQQPGVLPLLEYALTELYEACQGQTLTLEAWRSLGGALGALTRRADALYGGLGNRQKESARQMFLRLVTLGEGTEDTRRRTLANELLSIGNDSSGMDEIIQTFAAYRLLTLDHDPATRAPTVELAHEAIIREWKQLGLWLDESRADVRQQRLLASSATEWEKSGRESGYLLGGSRLAQFEEWMKSSRMELTVEEIAYLKASLAERERQLAAENERQARETRLERRSRTFLRVLAVVLLLATLGAFGLTGVAVNESNNARSSSTQAQSLALAAQAQLALNEGSVDQALALANASMQISANSAAQHVLNQAGYIPGTRRIFQGAANIGGGVLAVPEKPLTFVMVAHMGPRFPFSAVIIKGMGDACAFLNVTCRWIGPTELISNFSDMADYWQQALALKPDGIGTTILDPNDIRSSVTQAITLGIPVVVFNTADAQDPDPSLSALLYIGSDEFVSGVNNARRVFAEAKADGVTIVRGVCTNQMALAMFLAAHCNGVKSVFDEENVRLDILPISDDDWGIAADQMSADFKQHPETNAYFVTGPGPADAYYLFVLHNGVKPGQIYATTRDISPEIFQYIQDGYLLQAIDQQPYMQGFQTIISLYLLHQYGLRPSGFINTSSIVDRNNLDIVSQLAQMGYR